MSRASCVVATLLLLSYQACTTATSSDPEATPTELDAAVAQDGSRADSVDAAAAAEPDSQPQEREGPFEYTVTKDVQYGPDVKHKLDICRPEGVSGDLPAFVMIHGGGWRIGTKDGTVMVETCKRFAEAGYVAINVGYRLVEGKKNLFPTPLNDVQLAVRWTRKHASEYGIDQNRVCSWGVSAGGHLAMFLGVRRETYPGDTAALLQEYSSAVDCVSSHYGPSDLTTSIDGPANNNGYWGQNGLVGLPPDEANREAFEEASPLHYADASSAPMSLVQGSEDTTVLPLNATRMRDALQAHGVGVEVVFFDGEHAWKGISKEEQWALIMDSASWAVQAAGSNP